MLLDPGLRHLVFAGFMSASSRLPRPFASDTPLCTCGREVDHGQRAPASAPMAKFIAMTGTALAAPACQTAECDPHRIMGPR